MWHTCVHRFLLFASALLIPLASLGGHCQITLGEIPDGGRGVRMQTRGNALLVTIPLPTPAQKPTPVEARITIVNPDDVARAVHTQRMVLTRHQKQILITVAKPFEKVPATELEDIHWLRMKYEVRDEGGTVLASGIEGLRATTTDPFVLTAAASRVAAAGRPYRVPVHVKSNDGSALAGMSVSGEVAWEEDNDTNDAASGKKVSAKTTTNARGNATLEFNIPRDVRANEAALSVVVKNGLVVRSLQRSITLQSPSYLLLDTDKDIYQPGQALHARVLRFDSDRRAVEKELLDVRIEDEQQTLVYKQTITTDAFGVARADWQTPANLLQGNYQIHVGLVDQEDSGRSVRADKSVHIYRYDLPNFRVSARPDKTYYLPGQNADVTVSAEYLFGKPVTRGKIRVVEERERKWNFRKQEWEAKEDQVKNGELDRDGRFTAHFDLGQDHESLSGEDYTQFQDVNLAAYVTDLSTGRTEQRRFEVRVSKNPIHVYLSELPPEGHNFPATFFVTTFYADGTPARCKVQLRVSNDDQDDPKHADLRTVETNKYGLAKVTELRIPKLGDSDSLIAEARDARGLLGQGAERIYGSDEDFGIVQVSTSHALYKPGDPLEVSLRSSRPDLRMTVQAGREGVLLASQTVRLRNGHATVTFPYDRRFTDEVTIFAFSLEEEWSAYSVLEGSRTVLYPKNRQLDLAVQLDNNEHRPGEDAVARFAVRSADATGTESSLGIKIVDRAVEERAQTDSEFGQQNGWGRWRWSLWPTFTSEFGGISRDDLDHVNLTQPIPADLDLVAEYILRSGYNDFLEMLESERERSAEDVFAKILAGQFAPFESALQKWNDVGKTPHAVADLRAAAHEDGMELESLRDPWGTPYHYEIGFRAAQQIFTATSAGPDKRFGTSDDFTAHSSQRNYFAYYGKQVEAVSHDLLQREGRFIRDIDTLEAELLKRGVDFKSLLDPWGNPYDVLFLISGTKYVTQVVSRPEKSGNKFPPYRAVVAEDSVDYFVKSRETINRALTAHLNSGGAYPNDEAGFKQILRKAGVDLDELRDPWGQQYYTVLQKVAQYSDRVSIQRTDQSGERTTEPVTLVRQDIRVMSAGVDGKPGTADDFQVANYSILVSEQSAKDVQPRPAPASVTLTEDTGAITGMVEDATGAVVPNATVEAKQEGSEEIVTAKTDAAGRFELKNLHPGVYDVKASAAGFRVLEVDALLVQATNVTEISFQLSVGASMETVEVQGTSVALETTSSSMAASVLAPPPPSGTLAHNPSSRVAPPNLGTMSTPRVRQDFPETMLWEPALVTDRRGHAKLNFKLADNITTWKLTAVGSTKNGELGRAEKDLRAFQPFFVEHDPPRILTQNDEISYPLVLRNYLDRPQLLKAAIKPEPWFTLLSAAEVPVHVEAADSGRAVFRYRAVQAIVNGKQQVSAANAEISDAARKPVDVHPFGRPTSVTVTDIVDRSGTLKLTVPQDVIAGSLQGRLKIYPNLLAHVMENLEAQLEKPNGCGEQTISSTYPSLLVAEIFAKQDAKPAAALKAQRYLAAGYERLLRYQAEAGGFSYWGHGDPADLALTTYAVEFLNRAAKVIAVDDGVVQSAERWIMQQQGADGSWRVHGSQDNKDALLLTAYIAQTLASLEEKDSTMTQPRHAGLEKALAFLDAHRDLMDEPYVISSYALAAEVVGNHQLVDGLLDRLRKDVHQQQGGAYWKLERNTPFYGWGRTGELESTAQVVRALANGPATQSDQALIRQGLLYLLRSEDKDGMWYCGHTTVQVLKTLLRMIDVRENAGGKLQLRVNGSTAQSVELPAAQTVVAPVEVDLSSVIRPGENQVELESSTEGMMSVQLVADSYVAWGDSASVTARTDANATTMLRYAVEYSKMAGTTEDSVECRVRAERVGYRGYGMMLGEVGLPPGADVDRESLERALQGNFAVYRYDVLPDRVILYMWPNAGGSNFSFRFRPRFAMSAETAPSILYDYYNPEASVTLKPSHFEVTESKTN